MGGHVRVARGGTAVVVLSLLVAITAGAESAATAAPDASASGSLAPMCGWDRSDPSVVVPIVVHPQGTTSSISLGQARLALGQAEHLLLEASSLQGHGRRLRLPTTASCMTDVVMVAAPPAVLADDGRTALEVADDVRQQLAGDGHLDLSRGRTHIVFVDTEVDGCGLGGDGVATIWAVCMAPGPILHELAHAWGAVQPGATFHDGDGLGTTVGGIGHCMEGGDLLCYQRFELCPTRGNPGADSGYERGELDCNQDTYFSVGGPRPGSFLDAHPEHNIANRSGLVPTAAVDLPAVVIEMSRSGSTVTARARVSESAGAAVDEVQWSVPTCPLPGTAASTLEVTFDTSTCHPDYDLTSVSVWVRDTNGWHAGDRVPLVYGPNSIPTRLELSGARTLIAGQPLELAVAAIAPTAFLDYAAVPGGRVELEEQQADGSWRAVADTTLDRNSYGRFTLPAVSEGTHTYRARLSAKDSFHAATSVPVQATATPAEPVVRQWGSDRYATAVALSRHAFSDTSTSTVVLARGDGTSGFADALAGTPLAVSVQAPLLLTATHSLPEATRAELARVARVGATVLVLGGHAAVSEQVQFEIEGLGYTVTRIGGRDRYETATMIADRIGSPSRVWVASGTNFPDALVSGTAAARTGGAVLLTAGDVPATATTAWLRRNPQTAATVIGGPAMRAHPDLPVIAGEDRYSTAALVMQELSPAGPVVVIARGDTFPDALAGGAYAAAAGGRLLLTTPTALPEATSATLCITGLRQVVVAGGPAAVSDGVLSDLRQRLPCA